MKLSDAPSKIVGLALGELSVDLVGGSGVSAKYMLLIEDGTSTGHLTLRGGTWNETMQKALTDFIGVLEEEAIKYVFKVPDGTVPTEQKTKDNNEPPQF